MTESVISESEQSSKPSMIGVRHFLFLQLFLAVVIVYGMRANLSVGIVAMTSEDKTGGYPTYPEWEDQKQVILSSFFWGYVVLQITAGQLAEKYGAKYFLCGAMTITSLFSFLLPVSGAQLGYGGVIACRVIQGLSQGFFYPSIHSLLGQWTPLPERSKVGSFVYSGSALGTVLSNLLTGLISDSIGWPIAFYLYGAIGMLWTIVWFIFGSNSPTQHKSISEAERNYIQSFVKTEEEKSVKPVTPASAPWRSILTSMPVWAIFVAGAGQNWALFTLFDEIPTFLNKRLGYSMKDNSTLSSYPYLTLWVISLFASPVADFLISRKYLTIGATRNVFNTIGFFVPAAALAAIGFLEPEQKTWAVVMLMISVGVSSFTYSSYMVNHIDLSPKYAGSLMGITNGPGMFFSIVAPLAISGIESFGYAEEDGELWIIVFCTSSGFLLVSMLFYVVFSSGKVQKWNDD